MDSNTAASIIFSMNASEDDSFLGEDLKETFEPMISSLLAYIEKTGCTPLKDSNVSIEEKAIVMTLIKHKDECLGTMPCKILASTIMTLSHYIVCCYSDEELYAMLKEAVKKANETDTESSAVAS